MKNRKVIMWFRQDLRLHDNEALMDAMEVSGNVVPVYVFDERLFSTTTSYGFKKVDKFRAKFILESVADLKASLQAKGSDLLIRVGKPEEEIYKIAKRIRSNWVFCNRERTEEELQVQDALEQQLWTIGQEIRYSRGKMLYYTADLPFPISYTPDTFTHFRKEVEKFVPIREPLPTPEQIPHFTDKLDEGTIPTLEDLGYEPFETDERSVLDFKGGETAGLQRLKAYIWGENAALSTYKKTRNGMLGADYSSKFSAWLSQGCLSPKMIHAEVKRYEKEVKANDSTYWLIFELMWRDFFRLMGKKYGNAIFQKGGIKNEEDTTLSDDMEIFNKWKAGETGIPFIDANMRELNATGFMSNRGRQNVASFLVKDLKINWQIGAEYFESLLIDYDPCSNWCNWNYIAGVGSDPRENRYFNILTQAKKYDNKGNYVRHWLPELSAITTDAVFTLDTIPTAELSAKNIVLGDNYPEPMFLASHWE